MSCNLYTKWHIRHIYYHHSFFGSQPLVTLIFSSFQEWVNAMAKRPSSVRPSVNFCANRFFSHTNGRIAAKLSQDGLQVSVHPGCAQGQGNGQRSRDTRTFLDSWNEILRHWRSGVVVDLASRGVPNIALHGIARFYNIKRCHNKMAGYKWTELPLRDGTF